MKTKRQRKIIELITDYQIETQEDLVNMLTKSGISVTQATVSRDIKELNLTKVTADGGRQKYAILDNTTIALNSKYMRVLNDGILAIYISANILVIKTVSGMAMAVGAAIDAIKMPEILGCIAGDDTIMCVVDDEKNSEKVKGYLENFIA